MVRSRRRAGLNQLGPPPCVPTAGGYRKIRYKKLPPLTKEETARIKAFDEKHGIERETPEEAYVRAVRGLEAGQRSGRKSPTRKKENGVDIPWSKEKALEWLDAKRIGTKEARELMQISALEFAEWMVSIGRWERSLCQVIKDKEKRDAERN